MTKSERTYHDHAWAFLDFFNRNYMRVLRIDGTVQHYVKKKSFTKKYTKAQVYKAFLKYGHF